MQNLAYMVMVFRMVNMVGNRERFEAVVTNTIYYGGMFIAYKAGIWKPTLTGIALMFGFGNAFDTVISWAAYNYFLKTEFNSTFTA